MSTAQLKQWLLDQGVDLSPREHKRAYYLRMALPLLASPGAPLSFASPQLGSLNTLFSPPMGSPDTRAPLNTPFTPPTGSVYDDALTSARSGEPLSAVDQQQRRGKLQEGGKSTPSTAGSACATAGHKRAVEAAAGATVSIPTQSSTGVMCVDQHGQGVMEEMTMVERQVQVWVLQVEMVEMGIWRRAMVPGGGSGLLFPTSHRAVPPVSSPRLSASSRQKKESRPARNRKQGRAAWSWSVHMVLLQAVQLVAMVGVAAGVYSSAWTLIQSLEHRLLPFCDTHGNSHSKSTSGEPDSLSSSVLPQQHEPLFLSTVAHAPAIILVYPRIVADATKVVWEWQVDARMSTPSAKLS
ncbi:unnamed protein product [Closterium sp. Naga37s-1]|nr:unnamed protein product [Closterium sp. Naga37s-1]